MIETNQIVLPATLYDEAERQGISTKGYARSENLPATDPTKEGKRKTAFEVLQSGNREQRRRAMHAIKKALKKQRV